MPLRRNSLFRSQSISALHRQQLALWLVVERARVRPFFPAKFRTFQSATARTAQMRSPLNLKFQLAFAHIFSVSVYQERQNGMHLAHRDPLAEPPQIGLSRL